MNTDNYSILFLITCFFISVNPRLSAATFFGVFKKNTFGVDALVTSYYGRNKKAGKLPLLSKNVNLNGGTTELNI